MIVKVIYNEEGGFGHSFKGAVRYVASTPDSSPVEDRVDFVAVRNLPSDRPEVCWRLMASHARRRQDLMRASGLSVRGKGGGEVAHLVLSWADEERDGLTKEEMLRAADGALRYLKLDGNQCFMAAHNDTDENPHLHLIVSRVNLETGKLVSAWKSHKQLSKWALAYERSRGAVLVKQRERAWQARENGLTPAKAKKSTSKDQYELEKAIKRLYEARKRVALIRRVTECPRRRQELRAAGKTMRVNYLAAVKATADRLELARRNAAMRSRHIAQRERLDLHYRHRAQAIRERAVDLKRRAKQRVSRALPLLHRRLDEAFAVEMRRFEENEATRLGRLYNQLAYTDWGEVFRLRWSGGERGPSILSRAFTALSDVGHRRATLVARHERRVEELYERGKTVLARREERIDAQRDARLRSARIRYGRVLGLFGRLQTESQARMKAAWTDFGNVRRAMTALAREARERGEELKRTAQPTVDADWAFRPNRGDADGEGGGGDPPKPKRTRKPRQPRTPRGPRH